MSVSKRFFVDTNVLLYSVDADEPVKRQNAKDWLSLLWQSGTGCISWQVLHEFYVNALRKLKTPAPQARNVVETFTQWSPIGASLGTIQRAWNWMETAQLSYWDALIVAAAERGGCGWLLTEDLQEGRELAGVRIVNPFRSKPEEFGLGVAARQ